MAQKGRKELKRQQKAPSDSGGRGSFDCGGGTYA